MVTLLSAVLALASSGAATDVRLLTPEAAAAVFTKSPDFSGRSARRFIKAKVLDVSDAEPKTGWLVEVEWQEDGKPMTGRAVVAAASIVPKSQKMFFSADGWVILSPLLTGKPADEMLASLQNARRTANEANAIMDTRTIVSAQMSFVLYSKGAYGTLTCLATPKECNPAHADRALVDGPLAAAGVRRGYHRKLYLGPKAATFAYTSVAVEPGVTGVRGFCGDQDRLCFTADGREPDARAGSCPTSCETLESFR
jgi:hypothetical protein